MLREKFSRLHALAVSEYMHYLSFVQWLNHFPLRLYYITTWCLLFFVLCTTDSMPMDISSIVFVCFCVIFNFPSCLVYVMATLCEFTNAIKHFFHLFSGANCIDCRTTQRNVMQCSWKSWHCLLFKHIMVMAIDAILSCFMSFIPFVH